MLADIYTVQPEEVDDIWPDVEHYIKAAVERSGKFDPQSIRELIKSRKAQLWVAVKDKKILAGVITSIESSSSNKWVRTLWAGGEDFRSWIHVLSAIEQWAKSKGCNLSIVIGREGWKRELNDYRQTGVILEKVI